MAQKNIYFRRPDLLNIEITCAQIYQAYDDKITYQMCNQNLMTYLINIGYVFTYSPNPILIANNPTESENINADIQDYYDSI